MLLNPSQVPCTSSLLKDTKEGELTTDAGREFQWKIVLGKKLVL